HPHQCGSAGTSCSSNHSTSPSACSSNASSIPASIAVRSSSTLPSPSRWAEPIEASEATMNSVKHRPLTFHPNGEISTKSPHPPSSMPPWLCGLHLRHSNCVHDKHQYALICTPYSLLDCYLSPARCRLPA